MGLTRKVSLSINHVLNCSLSILAGPNVDMRSLQVVCLYLPVQLFRDQIQELGHYKRLRNQ